MVKCKNCTNLYNLSDDNDVIVGKWCPKVNDSPHVEIERECEYYKRMTQADRIRSMSDEELADFIEMKQFFALANNGTDGEEYTLKWLQSEVEVDNFD